MSDIIKMNYPQMEDMSRAFRQGAQDLEATMREMQTLADQMSDGALLGQGGAAFSASLRGDLSAAIGRLRDKFVEMDQDVQKAMAAMKEADARSKAEMG